MNDTLSPGERLRTARLKTGFRQTDLARILGVAQSTIVYWETNMRRPNLHAAIRMAALFGTTVENLFAEEAA